jgi:hypothetical protein
MLAQKHAEDEQVESAGGRWTVREAALGMFAAELIHQVCYARECSLCPGVSERGKCGIEVV